MPKQLGNRHLAYAVRRQRSLQHRKRLRFINRQRAAAPLIGRPRKNRPHTRPPLIEQPANIFPAKPHSLSPGGIAMRNDPRRMRSPAMRSQQPRSRSRHSPHGRQPQQALPSAGSRPPPRRRPAQSTRESAPPSASPTPSASARVTVSCCNAPAFHPSPSRIPASTGRARHASIIHPSTNSKNSVRRSLSPRQDPESHLHSQEPASDPRRPSTL